MVVSGRELERMIPDATTGADRVAHLFEHADYAKLDRFAVLLRNDLGDVTLHRRGGGATELVTYASESYFKIGSGDVLAAGFAHAWLEAGLSLEAAADQGARSLAWFIQDARLPLPEAHALPRRPTGARPRHVRILGSDTIEMGELVNRTEEWLAELGVALTVENDGSSGAPTLVLVGANSKHDEIEELANSTATASRRVVFSNGARWLEGFFPDAMVIGDYASALYHLLRTPSA